MSRHRAEPPPQYRPRYGRIAVLAVSVATTGVGLLGGLGVLPSSADDAASSARAPLSDTAIDAVARVAVPAPAPPADLPVAPPTQPSSDKPAQEGASTPAAALPAESGTGRRVVFSESEQRVWIVSADGLVEHTYLVSGSVTDNLQPGTYAIYSRSEDAYGIDDSGTMKWFVRFTQGPTGAAIGFHSIPVKDGVALQTKSQLGTPQSHGCIRQKTIDAKAMWDFATLDTPVVVVA